MDGLHASWSTKILYKISSYRHFFSESRTCAPVFDSKLFEDKWKGQSQIRLHIWQADHTSTSLVKQNNIIQCIQSSSLIGGSLVEGSQDLDGLLAFFEITHLIGFIDNDIWAVGVESVSNPSFIASNISLQSPTKHSPYTARELSANTLFISWVLRR